MPSVMLISPPLFKLMLLPQGAIHMPSPESDCAGAEG